MRRAPAPALAAAVVLLAVSGCTGGSERGTTPSPSAPPSLTGSTTAPELAALAWPAPGVGRRLRPVPRLYDYVCIDPPPGLVDTEPVRQRGRSVRDGEATMLDRALVYADTATAAEAFEDLRGEVARCGHTRAHDGARLTWTWLAWTDRARARLDGAGTETWHLYDTTVPASPVDAFVTLLRVGEMILVSDRRSALDLTSASGRRAAARAGERRLLDAVAALSPAAGRQGG